jgi:ribosome recycling factor
MDAVLADVKKKMDKAIDALLNEHSKLRTGRASVAMLEGVMVDYYGTPTPINQVATLSVPESRVILVQPWDVTQLQPVEKAIQSSDLGFTPSNDGKVIRIQIPALTEERRKEIVKIAKKNAEECKVSIRNSRRDANEALKKLEKDKDISEDDLKGGQVKVQKLTDSEIARVEEVLAKKEEAIMEV